ncbi:hypothetical protein CYMTET_34200 [Cymbomonas tetramitiformis]|uniref:Uncharacterized protein n=1 Tax=Cymbomonas tetramitiformis TaxID=36881 RepID=A0AAE0FBJ5_9CHLO|nr:hypothetical protein CYMTET_34200 [Cymbomonas tetramitiformis]
MAPRAVWQQPPSFHTAAICPVCGSSTPLYTMAPRPDVPGYLSMARGGSGQALLGGTACSGVVISVLRVITKGSLSDTKEGVRQSAHLYFIIAAIVIAVCMLAYHSLPRSSLYRHYMKRNAEEQEHLDPGSSSQELNITAGTGESAPARSMCSKGSGTSLLLGKLKLQALSVVLVYMVTLSIFPGFLAEDVTSEAMGDW